MESVESSHSEGDGEDGASLHGVSIPGIWHSGYCDIIFCGKVYGWLYCS
jgi:hypothetical protein